MTVNIHFRSSIRSIGRLLNAAALAIVGGCVIWCETVSLIVLGTDLRGIDVVVVGGFIAANGVWAGLRFLAGRRGSQPAGQPA